MAKDPSATETPVSTVACTVLAAGTTYGLAELAAGAKIRIPEDDAKKLESLGKVRIDGL